MSSKDPLMFLRGAGYISQGFPAPGLRRTVRHITGHNADGKGVFLSTDCGDHHRIIGDRQALGNILYSTSETPVDLSDDKDVLHAKEHEVAAFRSHLRCARVIANTEEAPAALSEWDSGTHDRFLPGLGVAYAQGGVTRLRCGVGR